MRKIFKNFSAVMVMASAMLAGQAMALTANETDVKALETAWSEVKAKGVVGNEETFKTVAFVADKLGRDKSQDVALRASKVETEVKAALRAGYVAELQANLDKEFKDYFTVEDKRVGIVLTVKGDLMDEDVARYMSDKMFVQDDAFGKDYRKVEFVNEKTGFSQVVPNYKIPRVAS